MTSKGRGQRGRGGSPEPRSAIPLDTPSDTTGATLFDKSPEDSYCLVWRRHPVTKKLELLYRLSTAEATEERVAELSGGGEYVVREKVPGDQGGYVYGRQTSFNVGGAPRVPASSTPAPANTPADTEVGTHGVPRAAGDVITAGILDFLKMSSEHARSMAEANRNAMAEMMRLREPKSNIDTVALVTAIGGILGPILVEMVKNKRDDGKQMDMMLRMMEAAKQSSSPMSALKESVEAMATMLGLKEEFAGLGGKKDDDDDKLLALVVDAIPKLLAKKAELDTGTPPPTDAAPKSLPAGTPPSSTLTPSPTMKPWQVALKPYRGMLLAMAKQGKNANNLVVGLMELVPNQTREIIGAFLTEPDCIEQFYEFIPEMKGFPRWTEAFFDAVAGELGMLDDGDGDGEGDGGGDDGEDDDQTLLKADIKATTHDN